MKRDPVTGRIYQESAIPTGEFGGRSVGTYGGVPARGMADGGEVVNPMTEEQRINSIAAETNNPENMQVAYDTRTDSQKALDYLMGKPGSTNPMMFTRTTPTGPIQPADFATRTGGHYVLNAATNTYTWIPDAGTADTGIAGLAALNNRGGDSPGRGESTLSEGQKAFFDTLDAAPKEIRDLAYQQSRKEDMSKLLGFVMNPLSSIFSALTAPTSNPNIPVEDRTGVPTAPFDMGAPNAGPPAPTMGDPNQGPQASDAQGTGGGFTDVGGLGAAAAADAAEGGYMAKGGLASLAGGGLGSLGGYSDGGQLLRGPGDGVSDSIPARIGRKQPARLADGEFVVPARIVSELGNGSTEAGARQLYKMLDRIQAGRKKTVGKNKTAVNSKSTRYLPA